MGATQTVYRLYRGKPETNEQLILARATLRDFSNSSQPDEDEARTELERNFATVLFSFFRDRTDNLESIATWEGGYPTGESFQSHLSPAQIDIWFAFDIAHPGSFVFGEYANEHDFWADVVEMNQVGEVFESDRYSRPANRASVLFLTSNQ